MKQNNTLQEMHDPLTQEGREPAYLIYNGVHYNTIVHERQGELGLNEIMPEWAAPPPKRKRVEQTQVETGTDIDIEEDEAGHGREDETRRKRAKAMIRTAGRE